LGALADNGQSNATNTTALGYQGGSYIHTNNVSNALQLGNASVSYIYAATSTITVSDERVKKDIKENVPGIAFIRQLRPVTFHYNLAKESEITGIKDDNEWKGKHDIENIKFSGFLAQEVEKAALNTGYDFSGVVPGKIYGLRYSEFVVPLVKAVQEQQVMIDSLMKQNVMLMQRIEKLEKNK
jgi:trimeric autotransporter adhesin